MTIIRPSFLTALKVEKLVSRRWQLIETLHYASALYTPVVIVPVAFETDFASVPRVPFAYLVAGNKGHAAAVIHDWLYRVQPPGVSRRLADLIFREALVLERLGALDRWAMYLGVRAGGWWTWRRSAKKGA